MTSFDTLILILVLILCYSLPVPGKEEKYDVYQKGSPFLRHIPTPRVPLFPGYVLMPYCHQTLD
jgi:hypothetical protein